MKKQRKTGAARALEGFDNSPTKMARALRLAGLTVTRQNLEKLAREGKQLSPQYVPEASKLTNIPKAEMNKEIDWELAKATP